MAEVAHEEVVEPKIENPQPEEKPLGETLKDLFSRPVLPEMTDLHLPLNLNIEECKGEQLRVTGDTDITVRTMLLKVSSIDGNTKLDALDIDSSQGIVNASGTAQLSDNWPVDITLNSTLNVEPLKGEKWAARGANSWRLALIFPVRWIWIYAPRRDWRKPDCRSTWK